MKTLQKVGVGIGIVGLAAVLVGVGLMVGERKAQAALPPAPKQQPMWTPLAPAADGSYAIPAGATFAISMLPGNPNSPVAVGDLTNGVTGGSIVPSATAWPAPVGTPPPSGWPSGDNGGTAAVRFSGKAVTPLTIPAPEAQAVSAWILISS